MTFLLAVCDFIFMLHLLIDNVHESDCSKYVCICLLIISVREHLKFPYLIKMRFFDFIEKINLDEVLISYLKESQR